MLTPEAGARVYSPRLGKWFSIDFEFNKNPSTSTYVYVVNNPISFIDPDGKNWFYYQGEGESKKNWHFHKGNTAVVELADGSMTELKSDFEKLVIFQVTGKNKYGAQTGKIILYDQDKVISTSNGFAGSNSATKKDGPPPEGTLLMKTYIKNKPASKLTQDKKNLEPAYGIQAVPRLVEGRDAGNYGSGRIKLQAVDENLNPLINGDRGIYYHGKLSAFPHDATNNCIADRSEAIFNYFQKGEGENYSIPTPFVINQGNDNICFSYDEPIEMQYIPPEPIIKKDEN